MPLRLFNTLGRQLQDFAPLRTDRKVGLYTCGPTVYAEAHLGNLRTYIFEDVLKRVLLANGFTVKHVMNITDVGHLSGDEDSGEDKVEKAAAAEHRTARELADHYAELFQKDLTSLNILAPTKWVKATDRIAEQIELVQTLEKKSFTYQTSDGIYFDTSRLANYGILEPNRHAGMRAGERVEMGEKKYPTDFALWKFSPKDGKRQMEWDSPWGKGFPGWHLECSAISQKAFAGFNHDSKGPWFDIHCGGIDHVAIHHTNEIAQTKAATGRLLARYWLHGEFLIMGNEQRMGKSEGNALTLTSLANKGIEPLAYRYWLLQAHYRSPLTFSWQALEAAQSGLASLRQKVAALGKPAIGCAEFEQRFLEAVNDDLNTPQGLAVLQELLASGYPDAAKAASVAYMDQVLSLQLLEYRAPEAPTDIRQLADQREAARQTKDWAKADELRKQIEASGWTVDDTPEGPRLRQR